MEETINWLDSGIVCAARQERRKEGMPPGMFGSLKPEPRQRSVPFPAVPEDVPSPGCFPGRLQYFLQTSSLHTAGSLPQSAPPFSLSRSGSLQLPNAPDFSYQIRL